VIGLVERPPRCERLSGKAGAPSPERHRRARFGAEHLATNRPEIDPPYNPRCASMKRLLEIMAKRRPIAVHSYYQRRLQLRGRIGACRAALRVAGILPGNDLLALGDGLAGRRLDDGAEMHRPRLCARIVLRMQQPGGLLPVRRPAAPKAKPCPSRRRLINLISRAQVRERQTTRLPPLHKRRRYCAKCRRSALQTISIDSSSPTRWTNSVSARRSRDSITEIRHAGW